MKCSLLYIHRPFARWKESMAALREYAVGTDDVGRVDAADIEVSTALQLLAEDPPPARDVAEEVLLGLEPAQALALCESSPFYQEICDSDDFRERYKNEWHIKVHLVNRRGDRNEYSLFHTRDAADAKELYERDTGLARTEYTFFNMPSLRPVNQGGGVWVTPSAQSSLGGMASRSSVETGLFVRFDVASNIVGLSPLTLTHWFANGETIDLSE